MAEGVRKERRQEKYLFTYVTMYKHLKIMPKTPEGRSVIQFVLVEVTKIKNIHKCKKTGGQKILHLFKK